MSVLDVRAYGARGKLAVRAWCGWVIRRAARVNRRAVSRSYVDGTSENIQRIMHVTNRNRSHTARLIQ